MIEHPLPQNITSYQFHLIGNMTIKQFLIMLTGSGIGFLFYTTNLPGIIKWAFMIFFFTSSAAVAFIPYEDRTLDQWLVNFIKAIYRPTKFYWRRQPHVPEFLDFQPKPTTDNTIDNTNWTPRKRRQVMAYLSTLQSSGGGMADDPLDMFNQGTDKVDKLFATVQAAANISPGSESTATKPNLQVRTRRLGQPQSIFDAGMPRPSQMKAATAQPQTNQSLQAVAHQSTAVTQDKLAKQQSQNQTASNKKYRSKSAQAVATDSIHLERRVDSTAPNDSTKTEKASSEPVLQKPYAAADTINSSSQSGNDLQPAIFDRTLPFPSVPSEPNMLVGMVHDPVGKILSGAIVEILDQNGNTVRAMKTNTLGQFYISSPLKPGSYHIETEQGDHKFPIYQIEINNTALDPINIVAKE